MGDDFEKMIAFMQAWIDRETEERCRAVVERVRRAWVAFLAMKDKLDLEGPNDG